MGGGGWGGGGGGVGGGGGRGRVGGRGPGVTRYGSAPDLTY